jgi:hypothetical protein
LIVEVEDTVMKLHRNSVGDQWWQVLEVGTSMNWRVGATVHTGGGKPVLAQCLVRMKR